MSQPIKCQALDSNWTNNKKYNACWFFKKILIQKWKSKWEWPEECGPENYFKGLTQETFETQKTDRPILEIDGSSKGLELEKQVPDFRYLVNITSEDFW